MAPDGGNWGPVARSWRHIQVDLPRFASRMAPPPNAPGAPRRRRVQPSPPPGIGGVTRHLPAIVGRSIFPPYRPALPKRALRAVDPRASGILGGCVRNLHRGSHLVSCRHQLCDQLAAGSLIQARIRHAPKSPAYDEIASVRRYRIVGRGRPLSHGHRKSPKEPGPSPELPGGDFRTRRAQGADSRRWCLR